ncbi:hypothetical protein [Salininema proteolyticum]|uniref:Uncharacterized protein n=1 Tax=Salininema proteolyticum TaxID=1607685 RepID=A0ABV8U3R2_9ACTN
MDIARAWSALVALIAAIALASGAASAHGGEDADPDPAYELVRQSLSLMVNTPDDAEGIANRVDEALVAEDTEGVDMALVSRASEELDNGDMAVARELLERSIDIRPSPEGSPPSHEPAPNTSPVEDPADTPAVLDEYRSDRSLDGLEGVLFAASFAAIVSGAALTWRMRKEEWTRHYRSEQPTEEER